MVLLLKLWAAAHRFCKLVTYLFGSDYQISFDLVQIQSTILASSTLQIQIHDYSGDLNIVICVGICTLSFYAINMDDLKKLKTNASNARLE
ncbi:hypothetical protein MTR_2g038370 [Medicago truncatula]|uniref:Transmembrane protein n=1 Tax=Medicago truncatula TaxID=3880 RepID=G7IIB9_MEDTR|nr:hypothetical protein MTR_2g038370 [Medicago truncatula]